MSDRWWPLGREEIAAVGGIVMLSSDSVTGPIGLPSLYGLLSSLSVSIARGTNGDDCDLL